MFTQVQRFLVWAVSLACTAVFVVACTPVSSPAATTMPGFTSELSNKEPVTVTFWEWFGGASGENFEKEAALFHEQYPWISVEVSHFPDQTAYREALATAFEAGNAPDVFSRRHPVDVMIQNNWIQPIDPWITPDWLAKFPDGSFIEGRTVWDGRTYSFPNYANKFDRMLYVNEDLLLQAEIVDDQGKARMPKTWSELRAVAKQVTATGQGDYYGIGIGIKDPRHMSWWFDLAGLAGAPGAVELDYRTGKYSFGTDPAYGRIVDLLLGLKADGSVYPNEGSLDDSNLYTYFGQGKFAMFLSGSWNTGNLAKEFPDLQNYQVIPLPTPDEGRSGGLMITPGQTGMYYMSNQTENPDAAWLWLDWLSSRGFHERMVKNGLDFSVYSELNSSDRIADPHQLQAYRAATEYLVFGPYLPVRNPATSGVRPEAVTPDVGDVLIGIYTGQISDWKQALLDLDSRKQAALESAIDKARTEGAQVTLDDYVFPDWSPMENYVTKPLQ